MLLSGIVIVAFAGENPFSFHRENLLRINLVTLTDEGFTSRLLRRTSLWIRVRKIRTASAPRPATRISTYEQSNNLINMMDSRRMLSSEPGLISETREEVEEKQLRKLSSSELPGRLKKRMTGNSSLPLPTLEEERKSSSSVINNSELAPVKF